MLRDELRGESLADGARRMTAVREIARENYASADVLVDNTVTYASGGYWVGARVWISDSAVRGRIDDDSGGEP